jgi:ubiquinone biosynthesis UbiH/UbiF/VisC/COQ6 family hydroxylase
MTGDEPPRDVIVIGAGLVGLALALSLSRTGLSVTLVDRAALSVPMATDEDDWDPRVYAISPGSAEFLHGIGAWQALRGERMQAIESMEIFGDAAGELHFDAYTLGERALAWIVESRALQTALAQRVRTESRIEVVAPCAPQSLAWRASAAELRLSDGRMLDARLVVGADGLRSWARAQAGLDRPARSYGQTGVVANFATTLAHRGRAFQWFLPGDQGVLAWLPLPGNRMSMVWSAPDALAVELMALAPSELAERVAEAGAHALGALSVITPAASFPLAWFKPRSIIGPRFALAGDAAHGVHPLAGQGVNLGFADAQSLTRVLGGRGAVTDTGAPLLLERYAARRTAPVMAMQVVTDGLFRVFNARTPWLRALRNQGMRSVDAIGPLKGLLARAALRERPGF